MAGASKKGAEMSPGTLDDGSTPTPHWSVSGPIAVRECVRRRQRHLRVAVTLWTFVFLLDVADIVSHGGTALLHP